jgi:hypothetical protein
MEWHVNNTILSLSAVGISVLGALTTFVLGVRRERLMSGANQIALINFLNVFRDLKFNDGYRYIVEHLRSHDPSLGITGLPNEVKEQLYNIAYYYQLFAVMVDMGLFKDRELEAAFRPRIVAVWDAIGPYVETERRSPSSETLLSLLENFAVKARKATRPTKARPQGTTLVRQPG